MVIGGDLMVEIIHDEFPMPGSRANLCICLHGRWRSFRAFTFFQCSIVNFFRMIRSVWDCFHHFIHCYGISSYSQFSSEFLLRQIWNFVLFFIFLIEMANLIRTIKYKTKFPGRFVRRDRC